MSIEIETSAQSMSESLDSLKTTPLIMHRVFFEVPNTRVWYALHAEAKAMFGRNYCSQSHVKKRIEEHYRDHVMVTIDYRDHATHRVWFEVPDPGFATWCAIKHAVIAVATPDK